MSKAVYRGVLELLKYLLVHIEADISRNLESPIFSVFLLFRLSLCLCMDVKGRYQSPCVSSRSQSRSPFSRTPSPDSVGRQWGRIINLFSESASTSTIEATKAEDSSEEARESRSTGAANGHGKRDRDKAKAVGGGGGRHKEETVGQEPLSKESREMKAAESQTLTGHVDSQHMSAEETTASSIELRDLTGSDNKATPTNPTQTTPTGNILKRVRTLTDIEVGLPKEGPPELVYLHTELSRGLGSNVMDMMCRKNFWTALFASVVTTDRRYLGWNENTMELYQRSVAVENGMVRDNDREEENDRENDRE